MWQSNWENRICNKAKQISVRKNEKKKRTVQSIVVAVTVNKTLTSVSYMLHVINLMTFLSHRSTVLSNLQILNCGIDLL